MYFNYIPFKYKNNRDNDLFVLDYLESKVFLTMLSEKGRRLDSEYKDLLPIKKYVHFIKFLFRFYKKPSYL